MGRARREGEKGGCEARRQAGREEKGWGRDGERAERRRRGEGTGCARREDERGRDGACAERRREGRL
eukprot:3411697-Rhodomonas_salina.1